MSDDLDQGLRDIARAQHIGPAARKATLTAAILNAFDFREHLQGPPTLADAEFKDRNRILAAFIRAFEFTDADILEKLALMTRENWAEAMEDVCTAAGAVTAAAVMAFGKPLNEAIAKVYEDECSAHGIFRMNAPGDPPELIGFREEEPHD